MTTETTDPLVYEVIRLCDNLDAVFERQLYDGMAEVQALLDSERNSLKERLVRLLMQPLWWCIKNSQPHTQELFYEAIEIKPETGVCEYCAGVKIE